MIFAAIVISVASLVFRYLGGCLTISAVYPNVHSTQPAPLSWPV